MDKAIEQVIEAIKQASPMIWAAAQHKVAADLSVAQMMFWLSILALVTGISLILASKYSDGDFEFALAFTGVMLTLASLCLIIISLCIIRQIQMAPDWYAMKAISDLSPTKK